MSEEQDRLAQEIYGSRATYANLTAWGKKAVDDSILPSSDPSGGLPNDEISLTLRVARLERQLEQAQLENYELWMENEELKTSLPEVD